ncbi:MAG: hypothetical protein DVB31_14865, partial [Verrucomicrobia bacterium]
MVSRVSALVGLLLTMSNALRMLGGDPAGPKSRHDLEFTNAVTTWDEALPLGNGVLGGLVWGDGHPLRISLDRTDLWDLTPVPEFHSPDYGHATMLRWHEAGRHKDLVRLYEAPYERPAPTKIPAGRIELELPPDAVFRDTSLSLADATARVRFAGGLQVHVFVHAEMPLGILRVEGARGRGIRPRLVAPPFGGKVTQAAHGGIGAGDLAQLGYPAPDVAAGDHWQSFAQTGARGFRFAAYLEWREAGGEWWAAWSVASSLEGNDPPERARRRVRAALDAGLAELHRSHREWWNGYWDKSSVRLPNALVERQWFLDQYKFGAAARRGAPPITLQGPWTADNGQLPPWKG